MNIFAVLKMLPAVFRAGDQLQTKGWYASKTIWFNVLVLALDMAVKVFGADLPIGGETIDALAVGLAGVGNIVLRVVTKQPLAVKTVRQGQAGR
jgi:hypothetical protein